MLPQDGEMRPINHAACCSCDTVTFEAVFVYAHVWSPCLLIDTCLVCVWVCVCACLCCGVICSLVRVCSRVCSMSLERDMSCVCVGVCVCVWVCVCVGGWVCVFV